MPHRRAINERQLGTVLVFAIVGQLLVAFLFVATNAFAVSASASPNPHYSRAAALASIAAAGELAAFVLALTRPGVLAALGRRMWLPVGAAGTLAGVARQLPADAVRPEHVTPADRDAV